MTEGERIVIQIVQMAAEMSVTEEQISKDYLVELLALRDAGKRTTGVLNLVSTIRIYWRLIVKYHETKLYSEIIVLYQILFV